MLAAAIGVLWLVGMTNAFNLLDNMDGLAGTLALIARHVLRDRRASPSTRSGCCSSSRWRSRSPCLGFLLFNFRPGKPARSSWATPAARCSGFTLGALGLATSWKVAETTVATLVLPMLVLAVPILDTALVATTRMRRGPSDPPGRQGPHVAPARPRRPLRAAARSSCSPRSRPASARPASPTACSATTASRSSASSSRSRCSSSSPASSSTSSAAPATEVVPGGWMLRTVVLHRRRLLEVLVDFVLISARFLGAYFAARHGHGNRRTSGTSSPSRCR